MTGRRAILIGVDGYVFRPLSSAVNDAVAVRDALTSRSTPGLAPIFHETEVTLLATPGGDSSVPAGAGPASRNEILGALRSVYDAADPLDFMLVYFAGHGLTVSPDGRVRESLILPADVAGPEEGRNMICVTEMLGIFAERGPGQQLWIIDACRDMAYQRRPRGYSIDWPEQDAQGPRAQVAIFAVAQGGVALSAVGGQGRFTEHLVNGLSGAGAATDYIPGRGHCVTAQSLYEYVRRRVAEALEGYDDWTRTIQLPQLSQINSIVDPLRVLPPPAPRKFRVTVRPPEAQTAVSLALEVQFGFPAAGWPPWAPPRVYELRASLLPGKEEEGWEKPTPAISAVDLREQDSAMIDVGRRPPRSLEAVGESLPPPVTSENGIGQARTIEQQVGTNARSLVADGAAMLTVLGADGVASVWVRRAEAPWDVYKRRVNTPIRLDAGIWDVTVTVGDSVIGETRVVLKEDEIRTVQSVAQITPATATVLPTQRTLRGDELPPLSVMPSESIGPMQGLILATLLPLLGLKLLDIRQVVLQHLQELQIPLVGLPTQGDAPLVAALAVDGPRLPKAPPTLEGLAPSWVAGDGRVSLSVTGKRRPDRNTATLVVRGRRIEVAAPALPGAATVISAISWPDGRLELSTSLFCLPVGSWWVGEESAPRVGRIARALALAAPLFRSSARFADFREPVLDEMAALHWLDPVLGALAFHAYDAGLGVSREAPGFVIPANDRETVRSMLQQHFRDLPDTRIIAALHPEAAARRAALHALLEDTGLDQPVLTASLAHLARAAREAGYDTHWAIERFDRIEPGQIFNAIRLS